MNNPPSPLFNDIPGTDDGGRFNLAKLTEKYIVLYFYPKDDTPGCTLEGKDFSAMLDDFAAAGCAVFGVSADGVASHQKFRAKFNYQHHLLADTDYALCRHFAVCKEGSSRISRSTFLLRADGTPLEEWRDIKSVGGHAQEVLESVRRHAAADGHRA